MQNTSNPVARFELPVVDMERAMKFYSTVFAYSFTRKKIEKKDEQEVIDMARFPMSQDWTWAMGSLVHNKEYYSPSAPRTWPILYFSAPSWDLQNELSKVELAWWKIMIQKTPISKDHGFMALVLDTEGNRIALHSSN